MNRKQWVRLPYRKMSLKLSSSELNEGGGFALVLSAGLEGEALVYPYMMNDKIIKLFEINKTSRQYEYTITNRTYIIKREEVSEELIPKIKVLISDFIKWKLAGKWLPNHPPPGGD